MKHNFKLLLLMAALLETGFVSCSEKNNEPEQPSVIIELTTPADQVSIDLSEVEKVIFTWTSEKIEGDYTLLLSQSANLALPATYVASNNSIELSAPALDALLKDFGTPVGESAIIYWSVKLSGYESAIPVARALNLKRFPPGIILTEPANHADFNIIEMDAIVFAWYANIENSSSYTFKVSSTENLSGAQNYTVAGSSYTLSVTLLDQLLDNAGVAAGTTGKLYWTVVPVSQIQGVNTYIQSVNITRFPSGALPATLKLSGIFANNMVLQRQTSAPVWGIDIPGTSVKVTGSWDNQTHTATANAFGRWKVNVQTPAAGGPYTVKIEGSKTVTLTNVLIGEVWLASGQSNMALRLRGDGIDQPVEGSAEAIANANDKKIHFINIPVRGAYKPLDDYNNFQWSVATSATAGECSAIGWFFADALQTLDIPIGIINASVGATSIQTWMPRSACERVNGVTVPAESDRTTTSEFRDATIYYNGMIHPLKGYAIKGLIWYQGESNVGTTSISNYISYEQEMIREWRARWNCGDFAFYFAQIAPYGDYGGGGLQSAYIREAQLQSQKKINSSAMAVLLDIGEQYQIHPKYKRQVGDRLAKLALAKMYGNTGFEAESPEYERMEVNGTKITLYFSKALATPDEIADIIVLFEVAGADKKFYPATQVVVNGNTLVVSAASVQNPVAARYAFKDFVVGKLFGSGRLPVSSFRTDNW